MLRLQIFKENKGKSGIYRWVNNKNGKSYVGSAVNISKRLKEHFYNINSNVPLQRAIQKYGLSKFSIEILEYCDMHILIEREQYYLKIINQKYNINPIAGSSLGAKHSEETRKKMSAAQLGEKNHNFGKIFSESTKNKMSLAKGTSIKVYSLDLKLLYTFTSATKAKLHFRSKTDTILKYARSRNIFRDKYILSLEHLKSGFQPIIPKKSQFTIFVNSLDSECLYTFPSSRAAAKHFIISTPTILKYVRSGKIFQDKYILSLYKFPSPLWGQGPFGGKGPLLAPSVADFSSNCLYYSSSRASYLNK